MNRSDVPDAKAFEAILASLRLWLLDVLAALVELFGKHRPVARDMAAIVCANLHAAEYDMKRAILGLAILRMRIPKPPQTMRPPPGYAFRRCRASDLRVLTHGVFNARPLNLRARIARLRGILDHVERWTARLLKRLTRGFRVDSWILAAPPVVRAYAAPAPARAPADSS